MIFAKTAVRILATLALTCLPSLAQTKLVFNSDASFPPMESLDSNQNVVGYDADMIAAVAKAAGFTAVVKNAPWDGIFKGLAAGTCDAVLSSVTITDQRSATMDFSLPYLNAGQVIVERKDSPALTTLKQLRGRKVGVQSGTTGAAKVARYRKIQMKKYDEASQAVADLALGKVDAVVVDSPSAASYVFQNEQYKGKLQIVGSPLTDEYYGIAVKKGNDKVLKLINQGLTIVITDGTLDKLEQKWLR